MKKADSPKLVEKQLPDFSREDALLGAGALFVAGVDEAGRGPLAGPVVVAAAILDPKNIPKGLNDSKKLSAKRRENLFEKIVCSARFALISVPPAIIEKLNIRGATLWGMAQAIKALPVRADFALIDGRDVPPDLTCQGEAIIKGDSRSVSIAAASILAKVTRDHMCLVLDKAYPGYGFSSHKGYGTTLHMDELKRLGASVHHRALFAPVAAALKMRDR